MFVYQMMKNAVITAAGTTAGAVLAGLGAVASNVGLSEAGAAITGAGLSASSSAVEAAHEIPGIGSAVGPVITSSVATLNWSTATVGAAVGVAVAAPFTGTYRLLRRVLDRS